MNQISENHEAGSSGSAVPSFQALILRFLKNVRTEYMVFADLRESACASVSMVTVPDIPQI